MSDQTTYTMYRKDARGTIEVDLNDPVYSLSQLVEKARVEMDEKQTKFQYHAQMTEFYEGQVEQAEKVLHRIQTAQDVVRKALGPSDRELSEEETDD